MGVTKQMITRLYILNPIPQWSIAPVSASRFIEYHHRRFMSYNDVHIISYQIL